MKIFNQKQLAITLLGLIVLPFVFLDYLLVSGGQPAFLQVSPLLALHGLAVTCLAFYAGIQWGVHFCKRTEDSVYIIVFFVLVTAMLSLLDPVGIVGLAATLAAFVASCVVELRLSRQRVTTLWYWRTRCACSLLIALSLVLALFLLASRNI